VVRVWPQAPPQGYVCPAGTACQVASASATACPPRYYANSTGQSSCDLCPPGGLCTGATSAPATCPLRHYCPIGSHVPTACPAGSFGEFTGLKQPSECSPCPPGRFCSNGAVTAECWGGYVCVGNASVPDPATGTADQLAGHGYPCPAGFFCPNGTSVEQPCPDGTFSAVLGAVTDAVCGPCPPGAVCFPGSPVAIPCPRGHYCPGLSVVTPCPAASYNPSESGTSLADCSPCPAGTLCNVTAVVDPSTLPCPAGGYCGAAALEAEPCPAGTARTTTGGTGPASCSACPGGSYCGIGTAVPAPCPAGSLCPPRSVSPPPCPPGPPPTWAHRAPHTIGSKPRVL
jgi:hypothetical protein